jgi:hypothetical protein
MMTEYEWKSLAFGLTSTALYLFWARYQWETPDRHMTGALTFYALANVCLLWPLLRKLI